jgi:hypothetical protein
MPTKHKRINLLVPEAIAARVRQEATFLRLKSRVTTEDGRELASVADLVRWTTDLYIEACEAGGTLECEPVDNDGTIPFTLDSHTRGRWEYAVKYRYARDYHELTTIALTRYFDGLDARAQRDRRLLESLTSLPSRETLQLINAGTYVPTTVPSL